MPLYNQGFDLDSKKRNLKPVVEIPTAGTGIGLIMAQNKLHDAVCCYLSHSAWPVPTYLSYKIQEAI